MIIEKKFTSAGIDYCLVAAPHKESPLSHSDSEDSGSYQADFAVTEDLSFFPRTGRSAKDRQGYVGRYIDETKGDSDENIKIISPDYADVCDAVSMDGFILLSARFYNKNTLEVPNDTEFSLYALFTDKSAESDPTAGESKSAQELVKIGKLISKDPLHLASDGKRKALVLLGGKGEEKLLEYSFTTQASNLIHEERLLYRANLNKECIEFFDFENSEPNFVLRKKYRSKKINGIAVLDDGENGASCSNISEGKRHLNVQNYYNSNLDYKVSSLDLTNHSSTHKNLHIYLSCFSEKRFRDYDFLLDKGYEVLKIERNYSNCHLAEDAVLAMNHAVSVVNDYLEGDYSEYEISISGSGYASIVAFKLAMYLRETLNGEDGKKCSVRSLVLENSPSNLIGNKYSSSKGADLPNLDDNTLWKSSMMSLADTFNIPTLFISNKRKKDIWYGNSLAFFSALKFFGLPCKYLLLDDESLGKCSKLDKTRETAISEFLSEQSGAKDEDDNNHKG